MRRPFRFFDGKKGGTFFTKEGTVFPSESCPRGENFTREFCPGGHYFQGDNLNCDTVSPTNTNFGLTFLLTRLQEALYEDLAV